MNFFDEKSKTRITVETTGIFFFREISSKKNKRFLRAAISSLFLLFLGCGGIGAALLCLLLSPNKCTPSPRPHFSYIPRWQHIRFQRAITKWMLAPSKYPQLAIPVLQESRGEEDKNMRFQA